MIMNNRVTIKNDGVLGVRRHLGAASLADVGLEDAHAKAVGARVKAVEGLTVLAPFAAHLFVDGSELIARERRGDVDTRSLCAVE